MIHLFYWSTFGWIKYGTFENMYNVNHYIYKFPKKQWKVVTPKDLDNIIPEDSQNPKTLVLSTEDNEE